MENNQGFETLKGLLATLNDIFQEKIKMINQIKTEDEMGHQTKVKELLAIEETQQNIREGFKLALDEMWEAFRQSGRTDQEATTLFIEARDLALRLLSQLVPSSTT